MCFTYSLDVSCCCSGVSLTNPAAGTPLLLSYGNPLSRSCWHSRHSATWSRLLANQRPPAWPRRWRKTWSCAPWPVLQPMMARGSLLPGSAPPSAAPPPPQVQPQHHPIMALLNTSYTCV